MSGCDLDPSGPRSALERLRLGWNREGFPRWSDRDSPLGRDQTALVQQPLTDLGQGQVVLRLVQLKQPGRVRLQRRPGLAAPRPLSDPARLGLQRHPTHRRGRANLEPGRRLPSRHPRRHRLDHTLPKIARTRLAHLSLPH